MESPRFVLLHHVVPSDFGRPSHFDLMFESAGALRTWAISHWPAAGESIPALQLPDHRLAYLEYEGVVSGDRGHVQRKLAGEYRVLSGSGNLEAKSKLRSELRLELIDGTAAHSATIVRLTPPLAEPGSWTLTIES